MRINGESSSMVESSRKRITKATICLVFPEHRKTKADIAVFLVSRTRVTLMGNMC